MEHPCDALVMVLPAGESPATWHPRGLLEREAMLWHALRSSVGALIVVSDRADPRDAAAMRAVDPVGSITFLPGITTSGREAMLSRDLLSRFGAGARVAIRTCQMSSGPCAIALHERLREQGFEAHIIGRAGHLWSRRLAVECSPDDPRTTEAGRIERELCRASTLIVGTTAEQLDELAWRFALPADRTRVIPNFVPEDEPPTSSDERDPATILCVGPFVERKRMDTLVRSAASIDGGGGRITLRLIGDGPERERVIALGDELGVRLDAPGWMSWRETREHMRRATIYADASTHEWHPRAVIEAMATGCPVVTNDAPGLRGLILNGATGVRIPDEIAESFSSAFLGLIEDPQWRDVLGSNVARVTRAAFGLQEVARAELRAIEQACSRGERALAA